MATIWFNHGLSCLRDALVMIRQDAAPSLRLLASHQDPLSPVLEAANEGFVEPRDDGPGPIDENTYVDYCLRTCAERGVDLFVAQAGRGAVAERAPDFAAVGTKIVVPCPAATLRLIEDKACFYAAVTEAGLPTPWAALVETPAAFDAALARLDAMGLNACVKPPKGVFGAGFWRLDARRATFDTLMHSDVRVVAPNVLRAALGEGGSGRRLLVLEHLPGTEWSVDCLCDQGRLIAAVARKKLGLAQRIEIDGPAVDLARQVVALFDLSGLINVQMKDAGTEDRAPKLLEINPRMSGGCVYTRHARINLSWLHVALPLGLVDERAITPPVGGALVAPVAADVRLTHSFEP